ncbi:TIGR03943 family putative permease subunit [Merismopedia glauca]|uniref:TIGR03943 family protein n=1 Tax=Merismopedia glauca CCAP 1448/3 TaxID=1296344 RepID=A0A2T1CAB0_9CYAN|nr:TIGR03943 family protein [Merismopedia glauca]PSB05191.1 TIGR03943 family protein [Merismopedia glauca CCAP 1448/3]
MSAKSSRSSQFRLHLLLDILAIAGWGILLLKYWLTNKLVLLIHPNYFGLAVVSGVFLICISAIKVAELLKQKRQRPSKYLANVQHMTLFPPGLSSAILLATAIVGLIVTPKVFASQTAIQRGIADTNTITRTQAQSFRASVKPEDRSLIDWVRTLDNNPEPDDYKGQKAKVQGFVVHPPDFPPEYIMLSRFVITCCAADVYPVGIPIKLPQNRQAYPSDSWLEVQGKMLTATLNNKRQLTIEAASLTKIPEPKNPYDY